MPDSSIIKPWDWGDQWGFVPAVSSGDVRRIVHVAGQCDQSRDDGHPYHPGHMAAQIAGAIDNLKAVLAATGLKLGDVVRLNYYVTENALSCADQQIFFEDERLASAIDEMNRYSPRKISVDPAVADLRINGMFRVSNQARFIEALKIALPVDVRTDDDGGLIVARRPEQAAGGSDAAM